MKVSCVEKYNHYIYLIHLTTLHMAEDRCVETLCALLLFTSNKKQGDHYSP